MTPTDQIERKRKSAASTKKRTEAKIAAGLCGSCGKRPLFTKRLCESCNKKNRVISDAITKARRAKNREAGLCHCGNPRLLGKRQCQKCYDRSMSQLEKVTTERDDKGLCRRCGKNPKRDPGSPKSLCQICCLAAICKQTLGNRGRWRELHDLLLSQGSICPYTGIKLVIGCNASIDHKVPTSRGGDHSLANLQWVHKWANTAKAGLSEDEFAEFIFTTASVMANKRKL